MYKLKFNKAKTISRNYLHYITNLSF
uniref:Uncharacterized protein n=1 Tax=Anguilla anguilla TaxID=7936 RepID=A0A0E9P6M6_ANGAN